MTHFLTDLQGRPLLKKRKNLRVKTILPRPSHKWGERAPPIYGTHIWGERAPYGSEPPLTRTGPYGCVPAAPPPSPVRDPYGSRTVPTLSPPLPTPSGGGGVFEGGGVFGGEKRGRGFLYKSQAVRRAGLIKYLTLMLRD